MTAPSSAYARIKDVLEARFAIDRKSVRAGTSLAARGLDLIAFNQVVNDLCVHFPDRAAALRAVRFPCVVRDLARPICGAPAAAQVTMQPATYRRRLRRYLDRKDRMLRRRIRNALHASARAMWQALLAVHRHLVRPGIALMVLVLGAGAGLTLAALVTPRGNSVPLAGLISDLGLHLENAASVVDLAQSDNAANWLPDARNAIASSLDWFGGGLKSLGEHLNDLGDTGGFANGLHLAIAGAGATIIMSSFKSIGDIGQAISDYLGNANFGTLIRPGLMTISTVGAIALVGFNVPGALQTPPGEPKKPAAANHAVTNVFVGEPARSRARYLLLRVAADAQLPPVVPDRRPAFRVDFHADGAREIEQSERARLENLIDALATCVTKPSDRVRLRIEGFASGKRFDGQLTDPVEYVDAESDESRQRNRALAADRARRIADIVRRRFANALERNNIDAVDVLSVQTLPRADESVSNRHPHVFVDVVDGEYIAQRGLLNRAAIIFVESAGRCSSDDGPPSDDVTSPHGQQIVSTMTPR